MHLLSLETIQEHTWSCADSVSLMSTSVSTAIKPIKFAGWRATEFEDEMQSIQPQNVDHGKPVHRQSYYYVVSDRVCSVVTARMQIRCGHFACRECCSSLLSQICASSSTLWSDHNPPLDPVNAHTSTIWFMVCYCPHSQIALQSASAVHLAKYRTWRVRKRFINTCVWWGRFIAVMR